MPLVILRGDGSDAFFVLRSGDTTYHPPVTLLQLRSKAGRRLLDRALNSVGATTGLTVSQVVAFFGHVPRRISSIAGVRSYFDAPSDTFFEGSAFRHSRRQGRKEVP